MTPNRLVACVGGIVVLLLVSCFVEIGLEGRPCPCGGSDWACDEESNQCVRGQVRLCGLPVETQPSSIEIEELGVSWRTDEALELRWTVDDTSREHVDRFELVVGTDEQAVRRRGEGATVFDAASSEHPELLRSALPYTGGNDEVDRVVLRDLAPNTTYYVRLLVFDTSGAVSCTPPLQTLTWVATTHDAPLFDETPSPDPLPLCVEHAEDPSQASTGRFFARYTAQCEQQSGGGGVARCETPPAPAQTCYENLRLRGLDLVRPSMSDGQFESAAHLRFDLALDNTGHTFWSELGVQGPIGADDPNALPGESYLWHVERRTFVADGSYRTYTAPLSTMALRCSNTQQEADDARVAQGAEPQCSRIMTVEDARRGFFGVRAGGELEHLGSLRLDNASIRY